MTDFLIADRPDGREFYPADCFAVWSRIAELSDACGYDPATQFNLLRKLPDTYPVLSGQDPDSIAEEHPMRALAAFVSRFLAEYPEKAAALSAAARNTHAGRQPVKAA